MPATVTRVRFPVRFARSVQTIARKLNGHAKEDLKKVISLEGLRAASIEEKFGVFFGRDSILASIALLETYRIRPLRKEILVPVKNSLITMAKTQGKTVNHRREEEPGKIVHEIRHENIHANQKRLIDLKNTGWPVEVGKNGILSMQYYGSVDSTPLFVVLACDYINLTRDFEFGSWLRPYIKRCITWMEKYGDSDGDGLLEFSAKNRLAILNQGWQDSGNSIESSPGRRPKEPIALVEVQGYAYRAYLEAAHLFRRGGDYEYAKHLYQRAGTLKTKFNRDFWMNDLQFFAHALDGDKNHVKDIKSNVGHLLWSGIVEDSKKTTVVDRLMQPDMLTPYGIRTLSSKSFNYSDEEPWAYHNGSIWPHDNYIIISGLKKAGFQKESEIVRNCLFMGLSKLNKMNDSNKNLELYLVNRDNKIREYSDSCKPQAWTLTSLLALTEESMNASSGLSDLDFKIEAHELNFLHLPRFDT